MLSGIWKFLLVTNLHVQCSFLYLFWCGAFAEVIETDLENNVFDLFWLMDLGDVFCGLCSGIPCDFRDLCARFKLMGIYSGSIGVGHKDA